MKKYILGLALAFIVSASFAQLSGTAVANNTIRMKTTLTSSVDSVVVTNAGSGDLLAGFNYKTAKTIQVLIVKTSGTLAGTMTLYGSNDGVNYKAITDATSTPTITTYTVTDAGTYAAPQTNLWNLGEHDYAAYKLTWAGTGTMVGRMKAIVKY